MPATSKEQKTMFCIALSIKQGKTDMNIGIPPKETVNVSVTADPITVAALQDVRADLDAVQKELARTRLGNELYVYGGEVDGDEEG